MNLLQPKAGETEGAGQDDKEEAKPELSKEETKAQATAAIKKNQDLLAVQAKVSLIFTEMCSFYFNHFFIDE